MNAPATPNKRVDISTFPRRRDESDVNRRREESDVNRRREESDVNRRREESDVNRRREESDVYASANKLMDASAFASAKWRAEGERALDMAMQKLKIRDADEARNWFEKVSKCACMYVCMYVCVYVHVYVSAYACT